MPNEDNIFVRNDEFQKTIGNVYEKINKNDIKHSEALSELKVKVERQTVLQEQTYEEQKETNTNIKDLTGVMKDIGTEMMDMKYRVQTHDDDIKAIQGTLSEKQKGSVQVIVAIIGGASTIIVAAIGFAQIFF